jgi:hypothetical protein
MSRALRPEVAEKVARFRAHWRWWRDIGHVDLIRQQSGQAYLVREVQRDIDYAMRPEYGDPYRPAYVSPAPRKDAHPLPSPWSALREENPFVWGGAPTAEVCLEWLRKTYGP